MISALNSRRAIRQVLGRGVRYDREASSGSGTVVVKAGKPTLKAQRQPLADFHVSTQRGRGNDEKAVGGSRDRDSSGS